MDRRIRDLRRHDRSACTDTVPDEMPLILILSPLLFGLGFDSGMLGPGVACVAIALVVLAAQRAWILVVG